MKILTLVAAVSLALAAGCDRNTSKPPSPKTDTQSSIPQASTGSSTTPANTAAPTTSEKREGSNPVQGQVDPKQGAQQRDFKQPGDSAGPRSSDTTPTNKK
ncbi:MAG TPA: hypothetical protein VM183_18800 [Burkholderiales bacterium]|nr:hypothetical protein [Burkholderiales bacterium]